MFMLQCGGLPFNGRFEDCEIGLWLGLGLGVASVSADNVNGRASGSFVMGSGQM